MADLHLFGGFKGGTGKSLLCKCAVNYSLDQNIKFKLFDADYSIPDVQFSYQSVVDCSTGIFSKIKSEFYFAAQNMRVLVNLPSNLEYELEYFFKENNIFNVTTDPEVDIYVWLVLDGNYFALDLLQKLLKRFDYHFQYIVVKNHGLNQDWNDFDNHEILQDLIKRHSAHVINLPELYRDIIMGMNRDSKNFNEALEGDYLTLSNRARLQSFLQKTYKEFERIEIFDRLPNAA